MTRLAVIKHTDDGPDVYYVLETLVLLADGKNMRGAESADAFKLPQVRKVTWKSAPYSLKDA
jgi:hypothetical protein